MELNFTLVTPEPKQNTVKTAKVREYSEEFIGQFVEVWMGLSVAPKGSHITVEFPDAKTRNEWFDMAKEYGRTFDTPVHVARVKNTESMHPDHGKLTFTMETVDEHTTRINAAKEKASTVHIREWAKEQGINVSERGRIPASVKAAYDNRPKQ